MKALPADQRQELVGIVAAHADAEHRLVDLLVAPVSPVDQVGIDDQRIRADAPAPAVAREPVSPNGHLPLEHLLLARPLLQQGLTVTVGAKHVQDAATIGGQVATDGLKEAIDLRSGLQILHDAKGGDDQVKVLLQIRYRDVCHGDAGPVGSETCLAQARATSRQHGL